MEISTFYGILAATCFTLVGLWWSVVKSKPEWLANETTKRLAGGVYASFLIPGLMSLGAQIGGTTTPFLWQLVFIIAAAAGMTFSSRLISLTRAANPKGAFSRNSWVVPALYALVLFFIGTMSGLGLSGSLLLTFFFWEITAFCSYALISFHNDDPKAVAGGIKAVDHDPGRWRWLAGWCATCLCVPGRLFD